MTPERVSTGVMELDRLLRDGYPRGSMVFVIGPVGVGKSTFAKQFLYDGAIRGNEAVLVNTYESPDSIDAVIKSFEWDSDAFSMKVHVLDLYSWRLGARGQYVVPPSSLTDVSIALSTLLDEKRATAERWPRLAIDILSDIFLAAGGEGTIKFIQLLKAKLAVRKITSLVLLDEGILDQQNTAVVESMCDGTVRMRFEGETRLLSVPRMPGTPAILKSIPFEIARGIELRAARAIE